MKEINVWNSFLFPPIPSTIITYNIIIIRIIITLFFLWNIYKNESTKQPVSLSASQPQWYVRCFELSHPSWAHCSLLTAHHMFSVFHSFDILNVMNDSSLFYWKHYTRSSELVYTTRIYHKFQWCIHFPCFTICDVTEMKFHLILTCLYLCSSKTFESYLPPKQKQKQKRLKHSNINNSNWACETCITVLKTHSIIYTYIYEYVFNENIFYVHFFFFF